MCRTGWLWLLLGAIVGNAAAQVHVAGFSGPRIGASANGDLGEQVNQAFAGCPSGCVVTLDAGTYSFSTPIVMSHPGLQLRGAGGRATQLVFTGTGGAGIDVRMNPFTIDTHDAIEGISIVLQNPNTTAILTGDITSATFRDLWIDCGHQSDTLGISIYLTNGWFERNLFESVDVKYCTSDLAMNVDPSAQYNSFGYNKFFQIGLNVGEGGTGVVIGSQVMLYHSLLNFNINIDDANGQFILVAGTSHMNTYQIVGEAAKPAIGIAVTGSGDWEEGLLTRGGVVYLDNMTNQGFSSSPGSGANNTAAKPKN